MHKITLSSEFYNNLAKARKETQDIDYEQFVEALFKEMNNATDGMLHAAIGISGEGGELLDAIKKSWAYGKPVDFLNIVEELSDLEFYMAAMRQHLGISRDTVLAFNMRKLKERYPQGKYSDSDAIARADKIEATQVKTNNDEEFFHHN